MLIAAMKTPVACGPTTTPIDGSAPSARTMVYGRLVSRRLRGQHDVRRTERGGERFADGGFEPVGGWLSADAGGAGSAAPGLVESAL
jgi:hypothetical protein